MGAIGVAVVVGLYVLPLLIVFGAAAWVSDLYERRHPPQNRRVKS